MTDHPLRPATRHSLGGPLPHQQADKPQPAPSTTARRPPFTSEVMPLRGPSGITHRFQWLFRSEGYVGYVLLTLSPLYSSEDFLARLACLIHAASVRSEPGSNPSIEVLILTLSLSWKPVFPRRGPPRSQGIRESPLFSKNPLQRRWHRTGNKAIRHPITGLLMTSALRCLALGRGDHSG